MGYYYICVILYVLIFKTHFTVLSFKQLLLVSDTWKGPCYCALIKYMTVLQFADMLASKMSEKDVITAL